MAETGERGEEGLEGVGMAEGIEVEDGEVVLYLGPVAAHVSARANGARHAAIHHSHVARVFRSIQLLRGCGIEQTSGESGKHLLVFTSSVDALILA